MAVTSRLFFRLNGFFLLVALLIAMIAAPQRAAGQAVNTVRFTPANPLARLGIEFQTAAGGGWWLGGPVNYGTDSTLCYVARFGANLQLQRGRLARVPTARASYNFARNPSALFIGGGSSSAAWPGAFVYCLDTALTSRWGVRFTNITGSRTLVPQGADTVVAYMTRSLGGTQIRLVRAWTADGTRWRAREIAFAGGPAPLIYGGIAAGRRGVHYVFGRHQNGGGSGAALIKLDTTKVYWSQQITAGGDAMEVQGLAPAANGGWWALIRAQIVAPANRPSEVVVARFDTAGNLLSSRRLTAPNRGVRLMSLIELPTGDVVLAGSWQSGSGPLNPYLVRLNAAGSLVWARRWNITTGTGASATLIRRASGRYGLGLFDGTVVELDANFNSCQFVEEPAGALVVAAGAVSLSRQALTLLPLTPTFVPAPLLDRNENFTRSLVCSALRVAQAATAPAPTLAAWPQPLPRGETLRLALPATWQPADTHLTLRSGLGQTVWRGPWAEVVALPTALPAGVWTLTATTARGQRLTRRLILTDY